MRALYLPTPSVSKAFVAENIEEYLCQKRPDRLHLDFMDFQYHTYSKVRYTLFQADRKYPLSNQQSGRLTRKRKERVQRARGGGGGGGTPI